MTDLEAVLNTLLDKLVDQTVAPDILVVPEEVLELGQIVHTFLQL